MAFGMTSSPTIFAPFGSDSVSIFSAAGFQFVASWLGGVPTVGLTGAGENSFVT